MAYLISKKNTYSLFQNGLKGVSPLFVPSSTINMAAGFLSAKYGLQGPSFATSTSCASAAHAIAISSRMIKYGDADVMLTGGSEKSSTLLGVAGFSALRALSQNIHDPEQASRPWDIDRDGFVIADGAAVLVLESYEHAASRNARILSELTGIGFSSDAFHTTLPHPDGTGAKLSMSNALKDANLSAIKMFGYINAHATSTKAGDVIEALAIQSVFQDNESILVSSTKSMTGHTLGAAGALESIFALKSLLHGIAPPTINLKTTR